MKALRSNKGLIGQVYQEAMAMTKYSLRKGLPVSASTISTVQSWPGGVELDALVKAHAELVAAVHPETPEKVLYVETNPLGNFPIARRLMALAIVSLAGFIALSMSPYISHSSVSIFEMHGLALLVNELFLLCAAGMGASFAALFEANQYITKQNFDCRYEPTYWMRFVLGLVAGLVLATLLSGMMEPGQGSPMATRLSTAGLALLGGFSSRSIYQVLKRFSSSLEFTVTGKTGPHQRTDSGSQTQNADQSHKPAAADNSGETPGSTAGKLGVVADHTEASDTSPRGIDSIARPIPLPS